MYFDNTCIYFSNWLLENSIYEWNYVSDDMFEKLIIIFIITILNIFAMYG